MRFERVAHTLMVRLVRRSVNVTLYSSLLGLFSFLTTGRKLHKTLHASRVCKCVTMKPKKLGIIGGSLFAFGVLICAIIFPPFLRSQIKKQIALKANSEMRDLWSDFPLPLDFKIYLFNVTNHMEIMGGATPIVQEVGPFFYDEYKQKVDMVDREEDDTLEYSLKSTWYFNPSKSGSLTGEEEIVIPHVLILSIVKLTLQQQPAAIGILNKAVDSIFKKPKSVFVRAKAREILFDGIPVDCTVKDFASTAICNALKENADALIPDGPGRYLFALFGPKNGTVLPDRIRVMRGIKNYKDVGRVTEVNGKTALDIWSADHCNQFNGTDSTIFAPLLTEKDDIVSFSPDICRSLGARFDHKTKVKGINTFHYTADLGDMSTNPLEKCFCPTPETCLTKNLLDLTKCVGAPLIASLPHFLGSEEKYCQMVQGLHPNEEDHGIAMDFEPMTATPLSAHKRLQFNIALHKVEKFKLMKNFPECLFPVFWVEEGILLDDEFVKKLKTVFKTISIVGFLKWLTIISGICISAAAAAMFFKNKDKGSLDITKVTPHSQNGKGEEQKKWPNQMNISTIQSAAVPPNLDAN
ncbi:PREDICTED: sensory neuron membrane protein 1-like [Eufriesea mexicana]|uniref:sensory neuron membrane protein 1-like n=1 Tax=Eufriesea mexicana TaxID=516756 RepID=UPI00083C79B7|nr:PREDICTED: sensory neuron membrane protein 1-like [Eufriesea mexicana]XP_017758370.1 PREDICTED: sensory neuron membrane protein 1-like [Eufriesea mexicana]